MAVSNLTFGSDADNRAKRAAGLAINMHGRDVDAAREFIGTFSDGAGVLPEEVRELAEAYYYAATLPDEPEQQGYHGKYNTTGDLRGATWRLYEALRGTEHETFAREVCEAVRHFLPGIPGRDDATAEEVRSLLGAK
jgi:hypothetical protein